MIRPYLIIRGFYFGENLYSDVLRRWLAGYQRFGQTRCLYFVAGSGGDVTSERSHVPDNTVSCLRRPQYETPRM